MEVNAVMDVYQTAAKVLKAVAHPERVRLLAALRDHPQCVCHLTALLAQRQPYVSQQLACLRAAGLVADYREGARVYYRICDPRVFALLDAVGAMIGNAEALRSERLRPHAIAGCPCPGCAAV